ncbi:hypothetical protein K488DRAFT_86267 [Vararia minispora EC-137]|uniref:Uncharacterized protein n=1 Tax=Vararia minispora EC-137 TaxID=1314806 RepID=A0ACB8QJV6_9AGAM|nr:hypothetical protein K488DRAFT_86267 [Vararia minispora EC-137]
MPALQVSHDFPVASSDLRSLNHVNLMVDTFIANATPDDIRAAVRALLATTAPSTANAFSRAARARLTKAYSSHVPVDCELFVTGADGLARPSKDLSRVLCHARSLYGAGLGLLSLDVFDTIVHSTLGFRWADDGETADVLAIIDQDLCQAIQSTKEEIESGRAGEPAHVRAVVAHVRATVQQSVSDVAGWSDQFPFERAAASLDIWKL